MEKTFHQWDLYAQLVRWIAQVKKRLIISRFFEFISLSYFIYLTDIALAVAPILLATISASSTKRLL